MIMECIVYVFYICDILGPFLFTLVVQLFELLEITKPSDNYHATLIPPSYLIGRPSLQ